MGSEDLLTKFNEMVKRFNDEFKEIIEGERARMRAEVEAYNVEKQKMKAVEVSDDDIVHLNVGGQKLTTKRSSLCQIEGSLLASMFSGRWEDGIARDKDGCVFFDFNPQNFGFILDYLRAKKIATAENPAPLPNVPEDQMKNFKNLVEYLGLSDEIYPTPSDIRLDEMFNEHSTRISLQEGGKVAVHNAQTGYFYVLGQNLYQQGIVRFKLKLESFQNNHWMLVGIAKADAVQQNTNTSHFWPGSYSWGLGGTGQVWKNGSCTYDNTLPGLSKQGDIVELVLDCDAAKLSLHLPSHQQFHIDIPTSQTWRLHVNLYGANDKIRIMDA